MNQPKHFQGVAVITRSLFELFLDMKALSTDETGEEAERYRARYAIMLVHSFSQTDHWLEDYEKFLDALGSVGGLNKISCVGERSGIIFYTAWVRGDELFLTK